MQLIFQWKLPLGLAALAAYLNYNPNSFELPGDLTLEQATMGLLGLAGLIIVNWTRYWAWTITLWPVFLQGGTIAVDNDWENMLSMSAPTSKYLKLSGAYKGYANRRISLLEFVEAYRHGHIDVKMDMFELLQQRFDWSSHTLTWHYFNFILTGYIPDVLFHTRAQDEAQVTEHYDRGNDFFGWYLGPRMCYTCGYFVTGKETLDTAQDQKMNMILRKIQLEAGEELLDIGCGWGTLAMYAAKHFGANSTGVTISKNQVEFAEARCEEMGLTDKVEYLCMDYRDIPKRKWDKITCLEMAEHVGMKNFGKFLRQVLSMLEDDGMFYLQIAGLREMWQEEDLSWGVFMNKYIFPGADASLPLNWVIRQFERNGLEIHSVEVIGVHYADTIFRWYENWLSNKEDVIGEYGEEWYRTWEVFLAWSSIFPAEGGGSCYQIVSHPNLREYDRRKFYGEGAHIFDWDAKSSKF